MMASIPFTSFSAVKVHQTIKEQKEQQKKFGSNQPNGVAQNKYNDRTQHNYNSKYMNSVWGLYNRYAPQAFQKNEELINCGQLKTASSNAKVFSLGNGEAV